MRGRCAIGARPSSVRCAIAARAGWGKAGIWACFPLGTASAHGNSSKVQGVDVRHCTPTLKPQQNEQSEIRNMKLSSLVMTAGVAVLMCLNAAQLEAQGQGRPGGQAGQGRANFDPDQMRQRMMDGVREQLEVKNDAEWQIIEQRVNGVWEARREVGAAGAGGMRMMARRPQGGDNAPGAQGGRRFGAEPSAEEAALQKAIDSNASTAELKSAITKYREARKQKEAALEKAQQELKEVLNLKQEAVALSMGLIN
jgi:hypothetical protein